MFVLLSAVVVSMCCVSCAKKSPLAGRIFVQYNEQGEISEIMSFGEDGQFVAGAWLVGGGKYELGRADNGKDTIKLINARTGEDITEDLWFTVYDPEKDELSWSELYDKEKSVFTELK